VDQDFQVRREALFSLAQQIRQLSRQNVSVILVSSGAIALGMGELGFKRRPADVVSLQALAAVGQAALMKVYSEIFFAQELKCAQVLLTWDDFDNRIRRNNARQTLMALLDHGVVPVINENDTVSTEEIKFGDNDKLSAFVASLVGADLLVILSDVDGLYDPAAKERTVYDEVKEITPEIAGLAQGTLHGEQVSRGGMSAKLDAIKVVAHAKIPCVIASGATEDVLRRIVSGEQVGTFFLEKGEKLIARKHWLAFVAKPKGILTVDDGAREALMQKGRSLLLPGVVAWDGHFKGGDVVLVCDKEGKEIARGITNYSISDLHKLTDRRGKKEIIHCNDLAITRI